LAASLVKVGAGAGPYIGFVMVVVGSSMSCEVRLKVINWFFGLTSIVWEPIMHWFACCKGTDICAFGAEPSNMFLPIVWGGGGCDRCERAFR
jgi:hypothetical protein